MKMTTILFLLLLQSQILNSQNSSIKTKDLEINSNLDFYSNVKSIGFISLSKLHQYSENLDLLYIIINNLDSLYSNSCTACGKHWIGVRTGIQTKPKIFESEWKLEDWWALFICYEYRFTNNFSLITEYHLFHQNIFRHSNLSALEVGLNVRILLLENFNISFESGVAIGKLAPSFPLFYGSSLDFFTDEKISIKMNIRSFVVPDYGYWISIGLNYNIIK